MDEAGVPETLVTQEDTDTWLTRLFWLVRQEPALAAMAVMAVIGIAISVYLTTVHYAKVPLICSTSGIVDCAPVLRSAYSVVPGTQVPITIPGMLWFIVSGGLAVVGLVSRWRGRPEPERLRLAHFLWGALGLLFVLYLVYAEIVQLHLICAWCTVIHVLTLLTFLAALSRFQRLPGSEPPYATRPATSRPERVQDAAPGAHVVGKRPNVTGGVSRRALKARGRR